jgi:hypothetical protein
MLLLTPSVSGLFKWRQFEPEVILLAVGWYLRFSLSYRDVEGVARRTRTFGRPRYSLEAGTALRPGNGTTFALEAHTDERQLAGGRTHRNERITSTTAITDNTCVAATSRSAMCNMTSPLRTIFACNSVHGPIVFIEQDVADWLCYELRKSVIVTASGNVNRN